MTLKKRRISLKRCDESISEAVNQKAAPLPADFTEFDSAMNRSTDPSRPNNEKEEGGKEMKREQEKTTENKRKGPAEASVRGVSMRPAV